MNATLTAPEPTRRATWPELINTLLAGARHANLPTATITPTARLLSVVEITCATVLDGDLWAGWLDTNPQPFAGRDAVCWLASRSGWLVVVSAPTAVSA